MARLDLTGQIYGELTVIKEVAQQGKYRRWLCRCSCGNQTIVKQESLRSGNTKSCGCIKPVNVSKANLQDLTGQRFGKLKVIRRNKTGKKWDVLSAFWLCMCDCGNTFTTSAANLKSGNTKSCGCLLRRTTREQCLDILVDVYKKHGGPVKVKELVKYLPCYINTLKSKFNNTTMKEIWNIVEEEARRKK